MDYDPTATYTFTDASGNSFTSKGDNGYVWQSITQGVPISVDSQGNWYVTPKLTTDGKTITAHIPDWFKSTDEYQQWTTYAPQFVSAGMTQSTYDDLKDFLTKLGNQGAVRVSLKQDLAQYGVTDPELQNKYFNDIVSVGIEGGGGEKAQITGLFGSDIKESAEDIARSFKEMSKEELADVMSSLYKTMKQGQEGTFTGTQKEMADAVTLAKILNYVDDNYSNFGTNDEFQGLLEASLLQKVGAFSSSAMQTLTEQSIFGLPARAVYGLSQLYQGKPFTMRIEEGREQVLESAYGGLEGAEGWVRAGEISGTLENMGITVAMSIMNGAMLNTRFLSAAPGSVMSKLGTMAGTTVGACVTDFFLNDIPIDLTFFASDLAKYNGDFGKAFFNPEETQPLIGIPVIGNLGPEVPGGLAMNMLGDVIVDAALPILSVGSNAITKKLNDATGGMLERVKEKASVMNLKVQKAFTDIPVVGTGWKKFVNYMIGGENAEFIRKARSAAIAEGSMTPYVRAQNILTLVNHSGMTDLKPLYDILDDDLGISETIKWFQANKNKYGGVGETKVEWREIDNALVQNKYKVVPDVLPRDVKQGLLDIERLSELKGEELAVGGVLLDPARAREMQEIEARLEKTPQEIKDFANKFSDFNKGIEQIGVKLGITNEEWVESLQLDPRFEKYMTRQSLVPGTTVSAGGSVDPTQAAILNKARKGYYADNYLDPYLSVNLKAEALGRAYAWNERAKAVVSFELSSGNLIAGKGGVEAANRLAQVKQEFAKSTSLRKTVGYDDIVKLSNRQTTAVSNAFAEVNDLLHLPEKVSIQSVYDSQPAEIRTFVSDFNAGKITFSDGAKADLGDVDAAHIVQSTYAKQGVNAKYNAGISDSGMPYKYTIEDGVITSFQRAESSEEMAEAINQLGGIYKVTAGTIDRIGMDNATAINRTIQFYRNNLPVLPSGPTFKAAYYEGAWGWIPNIKSSEYNWKVTDGHLEADEFPIYLSLPAYEKGREAQLLSRKQAEVTSGAKPKNSATAESTPIHENGHNIMARLTMHEINKKVDEGILTLPTDERELLSLIELEHDALHERLIDNAMKTLGIEPTERNITAQAATISEYASSTDYGSGASGRKRHYEIFSEAMRDYEANGINSSKFTQAIVDQVKHSSERFTVAVKPGEVFGKNNLSAKGLFKNDEYAFPANVKTDKQKAKWLDEWRQNNPYAKGTFTEDNYKKANTWDTFFQKEIRAYNPASTSAMPEYLVKKNGDFVEELSMRAGERMMESIRKASVDGFPLELATMLTSRNSKDVSEALDIFLIGKVDQYAEQIARKMPGGLTEANLNKARITLWSEDSIKNDFYNMVGKLTPESGAEDIMSKINTLFETQAKGLAAYEALPVESKNLVLEEERLRQKLFKENGYAIKRGKEIDGALSGFTGDVTQVIHYKQDGQDVYAVTKDPVTASLLKRPNDYKETGVVVESIAQLSNAISRAYRIGTTAANPIAYVRNVLRDPVQATFQGGWNVFNMNLDPMQFTRTLRIYGLGDDEIKYISDKLANWSNASTLSSEIRQMGPSKTMYRSTGERVAKKIQSIGDSKVVNFFEKPLEAWESTFRNQIAQQSFVKNLQRTGDVDKSLASAMFDASNSTTNFSHSFAHFKRATATIPYLSSAVNGTRSFWAQFNADPVGMITRITAGFMVPAMAVTAWNLSDKDRKESYMKLPEWYRDSHIVLMDLEGNVTAVPIPDELKQYYGTARRVMEYANEASPYSIATIMAQGAFGFLPVNVDGFFGDDGSIQLTRGIGQMASGIMPQAATAIYEYITETELFTGQDLSTYSGLNKTINLLSNVFGTGFKSVVNSIGILMGVPEKELVGKSVANTLARDLFGMGMDDVKNQFMNYVGSPATVDENGKEHPASGLFAENDKLKKQIEGIDKEIAWAAEDRKAELEKKKEELINNFTDKVKNATEKYMNLYSQTGGLQDWQKEKLVKLLTLGTASSSASSESYQYQDMSEAYLGERGLAQQRYVEAGLPGGASLDTFMRGKDSIEIQAALNRLYGAPKQAAADYKNAVEKTNLKDIKNEFYDAIEKIYDQAEAQGADPDYDLIERIQARYLQAMDRVLVPIINEYGIDILNNNDFIDQVRRQVNGMIPSDDWKQSVRNKKKFLSKKDYPLATVDVKKWLTQRYASSMVDRGLSSDQEVTNILNSIKNDIDAGRGGAAKGKIQSLFNGIERANYYISQNDFKLLTQYNNMVK